MKDLENTELTKNEKYLVEELYKKLNIYMTKISIKMLKDKNLAEDAISSTFMKIINNIEKIKMLKPSEQVPYCITILKNECYNILRKKNNNSILDNDLSYSYEEELINEIDNMKITVILNSLDEEDRKLILFRYYENLKWKEIGDKLKITEEAARKRNQRILKTLKRKLNETKNEF